MYVGVDANGVKRKEGRKEGHNDKKEPPKMRRNPVQANKQTPSDMGRVRCLEGFREGKEGPGFWAVA